MKNIALTLLSFAVIATGVSAVADQIKLLSHGDEGLAARLVAIQDAQKSIDLATYIFEPCDSSTKLLTDALIKKAKAGVRVRVIVDAYLQTTDSRSSLQTYLWQNGIDLRFYNNALLALNRNYRSHIKLMVVDGATSDRLFFVGGRNNSDGYFGLSNKMNYVDQELMIRGNSARMAQASFEELWGSSKLSMAPRQGPDSYANFLRSCIAKSARDNQVITYFKDNGRDLLGRAPAYSCSKIQYVTDDPDFNSIRYNDPTAGPNDQGEYMNVLRLSRKRTTKMFLDFMAPARKSLTMENQYYLPTQQEMDVMTELRRQNVKISVLVNRTSDAEGGFDDAMTLDMLNASRRDTTGAQVILPVSGLGSLQDRGAVSDKTAPWRIHTKTGVRDDRDVFVSSFNIDPRSFHTNLEAGAVIEDCPDLAAGIEQQYHELQKVIVSDQRNCEACKHEIGATNFVDALKRLLGHDFFMEGQQLDLKDFPSSEDGPEASATDI